MRLLILVAMALSLVGCAIKSTSMVQTQTGSGPITTQTTTTSGPSAAETALLTAAISGGVTALGYWNQDIMEWLGLKVTTVKTGASGTTSAAQ